MFVEIFSCQISVQIQNGGCWTYKEQYEIETTHRHNDILRQNRREERGDERDRCGPI